MSSDSSGFSSSDVDALDESDDSDDDAGANKFALKTSFLQMGAFLRTGIVAFFQLEQGL